MDLYCNRCNIGANISLIRATFWENVSKRDFLVPKQQNLANFFEKSHYFNYFLEKKVLSGEEGVIF